MELVCEPIVPEIANTVTGIVLRTVNTELDLAVDDADQVLYLALTSAPVVHMLELGEFGNQPTRQSEPNWNLLHPGDEWPFELRFGFR